MIDYLPKTYIILTLWWKWQFLTNMGILPKLTCLCFWAWVDALEMDCSEYLLQTAPNPCNIAIECKWVALEPIVTSMNAPYPKTSNLQKYWGVFLLSISAPWSASNHWRSMWHVAVSLCLKASKKVFITTKLSLDDALPIQELSNPSSLVKMIISDQWGFYRKPYLSAFVGMGECSVDGLQCIFAQNPFVIAIECEWAALVPITTPHNAQFPKTSNVQKY